MAKGINKVILVGHLGQDPEVRYTQSGSAIANVSIATTESWTDKQSGQRQDRTEWHRVVFFNRLGEIVGEYLRKGSQVYVEGSLRTRKWQDQAGQDRYTTEIVASEMQMLGSRGDNAGGGAGNYNNQPAAQPNYGGAPQGGYQQPAGQAPNTGNHAGNNNNGGNNNGGNSNAQQPHYGSAPQAAPQAAPRQSMPPQAAPQAPAPRPAPTPAPASAPPSMDSFDDDIPF